MGRGLVALEGWAALAVTVEELSLISAVKNSAHRLAQNFHFLNGETVAPCKITRRATRQNISSDVRLSVVYPVQPPVALCCSAISARLNNYFCNFRHRQVTTICANVSVSKAHGPTIIGFPVPFLAGLNLLLTFWRKVSPPLRSSVSTCASLRVAPSALIPKSKQPRGVSYKVFGRGQELPLTTIAISVAGNF